MLNNVVIVGRISEIDRENNLLIINYSNQKGETETFVFMASENILENLSNYTKPGNIVGIKGHLAIVNEEQMAVADKVSILTSTTNE